MINYIPLQDINALNNRIQFSINVLLNKEIYDVETTEFYKELLLKDIKNLLKM